MSEYTAKRARTRGQLLGAGQELLPGAVRRGLQHALGPGPVTQRADVSRQTWYRYWRADDSAYLEELLSVTLEAVMLLGSDLGGSGALDGEEGAEAALALARAHFAFVTQRPIAMPYTIAAVLALEDGFLAAEDGIRPSPAPEIVRRYHERVEAALFSAYGTLLQRWGRRPRPGTDLSHIVELLAALADGYALRPPPEGTPDDDPDQRFARAAVSLLVALTVADPAAYRPSPPAATGARPE